MNLKFTPKGWEDYHYFLETDKALFRKLNGLTREVLRTPKEGTGQPEPLKHHLTGYWSRRINLEHRLVYAIDTTEITIVSCRYHYDDL